MFERGVRESERGRVSESKNKRENEREIKCLKEEYERGIGRISNIRNKGDDVRDRERGESSV